METEMEIAAAMILEISPLRAPPSPPEKQPKKFTSDLLPPK
jgi:hypothetical protein